jgi:hypothetical protein
MVQSLAARFQDKDREDVAELRYIEASDIAEN